MAQQEPEEQEEPTTIIELSLSELLEVQIIPVNVMGSHIHLKGEWMIGYHYHYMDMDGNRNGTDRLTVAQVLESFPITPTRMSMEMHMLEVMYGVTDRVTVMVMAPYHQREMDHRTRSGLEFTTSSGGIGDIQLMAHIVASRRGRHWWIVTPALSLPTGSIDERDDTPAGPDQQLPYPMQLGSGSIDLIPMVNYIFQGERWSFGFHAMGKLSLDENDRSYTVGDRFHSTAFAALKVSDRVAVSLRVNGFSGERYSGADPVLNPAQVHTADPARRGGERVDALLGLNFYVPSGALAGNRFILEAGVPVFQDLDGPQLELDSLINLAWQWTF